MDTSRAEPGGFADTLAGGDTLPAGEPRTPPEPSGALHDALAPGQRVGDRYTLVRRLGVGGMGEVWEVRHAVIDKAVAVKFFSGSQTDESALQRFWREARATAALRHPGIVDVQDFGTTDDGVPYIVMELLEGRPLSALLSAEGNLPWPRVRALLLQLTSALAYAHKRGVIHRDLKPSNIFLAREGDGHDDIGERCKIIDFGIAKLMRRDPGDDSTLRTNTGMLLGTPVYMSPEQIGDRPLDARSDIYSLGCVAYEMLTGRRPFDSPSPTGLILQHLFEPPIPPRKRAPEEEIPEDIEAVVLRALRKHPENRFQTMAEMRAAVEEIGFGHPPVDLPREEFGSQQIPAITDMSGDSAPPERRPGGLRWLVLAGALSAAAVTAWWIARVGMPGPSVRHIADVEKGDGIAVPNPLLVPDQSPPPPDPQTNPEAPPPEASTGPAVEPPATGPNPNPRDRPRTKHGRPPNSQQSGTQAPKKGTWEERQGLRSPFERDDR